jgi:UDP-N-acetylglucosamine--N-acetylmuramyl-(pentapeptide) pyrophosphoryl-undecaprenol N-acetylglucosamine transferase
VPLKDPQRLAVIAAGGTGGHMFPAEALARALKSRGWRVVLATDARGDQYAKDFPAEEKLALNAATISVRRPLQALSGMFRILAGRRAAVAAFRRLKPDVVVGFGGYPSLPALLAGKRLGVPRVIHEQNAVLGRVNRQLCPGVDLVACAFPTLKKAPRNLRPIVVGNPVRAEIGALYSQPYPDPAATLRILVTGGSQGARLLSEITPAAVAALPEELRLRLRVEQQTRMESLEFARETYRRAGVDAEVSPFFRNMAARLASAHLVIGRAGASTVCELATAGRPSILVPLGIAADDHQRFNAKLLTDVDAALAIAEHNFTAENLTAALLHLLSSPARLKAMAAAAHGVAQPDAAERLADLVEQTVR